jgi:hypothetical protein
MGDVVTFEHEIASRREIPTNPKISRIRKDLAWNDVLRDYFAKKKSGIFWHSSLPLSSFLSLPVQYL